MIKTLAFIILQAVPWYLFPGQNPAGTPATAPDTAKTVTVPQQPADSLIAMPAEPEDTIPVYTRDIPDEICVAFMLPFNIRGAAGNSSIIDFYSGALIAARELGQDGYRIKVSASDTGTGNGASYTASMADITIGPISDKDIIEASRTCPGGKFIISPLEQKAAVLCDSLRVIQVPTATEQQYIDIARWAWEEYRPGDRVFVIAEKGAQISGSPTRMIEELESMQVPYTIIHDMAPYNDPDKVEVNLNANGTDRFLIASEKESFVGESIRKVSVMSMLRYNVVLYCPSKVRSYENLNVEYFHNTRMRLSSNYFVDYSDYATRRFIRAYRAAFKAEPNSFAFHGYDTMKYFTMLCNIYGRKWDMMIERFRWDGLQTAFRFRSEGMAGAVNTATRRAIYNTDYTVSLVK